MSMSHTTISDEFGIVSVSYPLEKLVIRIIEEKDKLKWYKAKSNRNLNHLKQVISHKSIYFRRTKRNYLLHAI